MIAKAQILNVGEPEYPFFFKYLNARIRSNKAVVLLAVELYPHLLQDCLLRDDPEVVMLAVQKDPFTLQFADEHLKNNEAIVLAAVIKDGFAIKCAGEVMKKNKRIVLAAIDKYPTLLQFADPSLQQEIVATETFQSRWSMFAALMRQRRLPVPAFQFLNT